MAIHDVYLDNVFIQWNEVGGQKVVLGIDNEQQKIFNNVAVLNQIPDIATGVTINGMFEIKDNKPITLVSQFKVNYANGFITFHSDLNNTLITISHYAGRGIIYYPSSRIYTRLSEDGKTVEQTCQDMIDSINKYEYTGIYNNSKTYQINQQVYYNGSTYIAISTTLGNLPTDDNYWRIFTAGNNFLGDFNDTAQYYQRDCVQYDKAIYQCISKPPIGELPTNSDYWMQMISLNDIYLDYIDVLKPEILSATANANNARYKEDYSASVEYKVNNIVRYNNSLYICKSNTTGNVPTNTTYWDNATKAFTWQGVYNASTNYKVLDVVSYLGSSYVCIQNSTGNIPTNNTYFNVLALKGEKGATLSPKGAYNNAETYLKDDLVFYTEGAISGVFYAKQTTIGNIPTNTTYWEVFLSGGGNMNTATYDVDNTGVVDDSQKLGGELPSYYGKSSDVGDKTELDTDNKISLVNAINENVSDINTLAGLSGLVEKANKNSFDTLQTSFESHKADITNQEGRHGIRYFDEKLEIKVNNEWIEFKSGSQYPVGNVSDFSAKEDAKQITLTWSDPPNVTVDDSLGNPVPIAKWKGTKILRKTGSYPANENDGVLVVDNGIRDQYKINGFIDTGLINDTEYFYMAFPYTEDGVFTIDVANRISATPTIIKIYGIEIDESNSNPETSVVYTDDAVGFNPAMGNNGAFTWGSWESIIKDEFEIRPVVLENLGSGNATVNYALQHDDYTKKSDGSSSNLTGTDGDVMIEFGVPLWWKFTRIGDKLKIQLSNKEFDGAVKHAFEVESGYNQFSFYPLTLTQIIMLLMFKNRDTQTALGRGYVDDNSGYLNTGTSNNRPFMYGETTGKQQVKFLGLEDYWGNRRQWIDGCFYDVSRNMMIGKTNFNDTGAGYADNGVAVSSDDGIGYIDTIQGGNNTGFIPKSFGGSATTHYSDYGFVSGDKIPTFGGHCKEGVKAGGFCLISATLDYSNATMGGRLSALLGKKLYIGVYLGATIGGKLRSVSGQVSENNKTIGNFRTLAKANN